ncbi:MAG: flagellar filament capping protein FliD, partial [Nitrospinae bacterium]|nr:flagellar filament capping protein FliD [Nitrospinota bacterium]
MSYPLSASYWSATAHVGRTPPTAPDPRSVTASYWSSGERNGVPAPPTAAGEPASYWSATAPASPVDKVTLSDTVRNGLYYNRRNVPQVRNRGDAASAYRTGETVARLSDGGRLDPLVVKLSLGDGRSLDNQSNFFSHLRERLVSVSDRLAPLSTPDAFAPRRVTSSTPTVVTGTAGIDATVSTHTVTVERLAVEAQIGSDSQANPYAALGLTGSFTLNGVTIDVASGDSLADIADAINYGEDTNKNAQLDKYSEDLNGNNVLDVYRSDATWTGAGYTPSFAYYEDLNGNGAIDGGEDANDNGFLDGGTAQSGAAATIVAGRLVITNTQGGDRPLTLTESGDVMTTLGFFRVDEENQKILKTPAENEFVRLPQTAAYTLDGVAATAPRNTLPDALPGVSLELTGTSPAPVTLSVVEDPSGPTARIEAFAGAYNDMIRLITEQSLKNTPVQEDVRTQDLALQTALSAHRQVASLRQEPRSLSAIGLAPGGSMPQGIDPATLERLERRQADPRGATPLAAGAPGLIGSLHRMGITSEKDLTLTIDRERLAATLKEDPQGVYRLFNTQPDGIAPRLQGIIDKATGEPNGVIAYRQAALDHYRRNPGEAQKLMAGQAQATRIAIDTGIAGKFFGS